ncbi:MAG: PQQ-binding-like beta-propeller repeat protein [Planctomycetaceae bacterium]
MATIRANWWLAGILLLIGTGVAAAAEPPPMVAVPGFGERDRGLCLIVGDDDGRYAVDVAKRSALTIYVQVETEAQRQAVARAADEAGLLGTRITVGRGSRERLHLADGLVDVLVDAGVGLGDAGRRLNREEVLRVLRPGGKAYLGDPEPVVAPAREGHDEWTHPFHGPDNNPLSADRTVTAPYLTKFLAEPYFCPLPEITVISGGRMFKAFGNRSSMALTSGMVDTLAAFNAYNGTELWTRKLSPGFMIHRNTMIATPDALYLADDTSCKRIAAATGEVIDEIVAPPNLTDGPVWKWMALEDGVLYALVGEEEPKDEGTLMQGGGAWHWWRLDDYRFGYGRTFLAFDVKTKKLLWHRREADPIDSRSVCLAAGRIFAHSDGKFVRAFSTKNGTELWKTTDEKTLAAIGRNLPAQSHLNGFRSTPYAKATADALYYAGPTRAQLVALSARDGSLLWTDKKHGDYQLVLRDDGLFAISRTGASGKLDPLSGKIIAELENCTRGNCTRATGTVDSIFTRGHHHAGTLRITRDDLATRLPVMRPACQDGVIASNGQLYWGPWMCSCNLSLVGIISLAPAGDFAFDRPAKEAERLEVLADRSDSNGEPPSLAIDDRDWPTYRAGNARRGGTAAVVPAEVKEIWTWRVERRSSDPDAPSVRVAAPAAALEPTAPIAAGGLVFLSGADGAVRAIDAATGKPKWTAYTGGPVHFPPTLWNGRLYVGGGDGFIHAFAAASGEPLWRFRAAPVERHIPVYGRIASTWPVASGVLVEDGVAYAAAGIMHSDGTHVHALDALTGKLRWRNDTSGRLMPGDEMEGVSVQGHLLANDGKLYLAGGNVASPAAYDMRDGKYLTPLDPAKLWETKAARGRDLSLVDGKVIGSAWLLYAPREQVGSNYVGAVRFRANSPLHEAPGMLLLEAGREDLTVRAVPKEIIRRGESDPAWSREELLEEPIALAVGKNAAVAAGKTAEGEYAVVAIDLRTGETLWSKPLPSRPVSWGLALDREGRALVSLLDGRLVCFGG